MFVSTANRTSARYIGTVDMTDANDKDFIVLTRKIVKEANTFFAKSGSDRRMYVKIRGRGHRMGIRKYNQDLPLQFAKTADVYVYDR